jgi:hypothetical protein
MDRQRRAKIQQLIQTLQAIQEQVNALWIEEEGEYEGGSSASKQTASGQASIEAAFDLGEAADQIQGAIEHMQEAIGYGD